MPARTILRLHGAHRDDIGDLRTQRPLPTRELDQLDPFLFLNHHGPQVYPPGNRGLPFGPHPHRGFETVTFIVEGSLMHRDSGGHESVIEAGGVQWMTAGRGLEHAELSPASFLEHGGPLEILQLWVNLPPLLKMAEPRYTGLQRDEIPVLSEDGGRVAVQVIAGELGTVRGPVESLTGVVMTTVELAAGAKVALPAPAARTPFLYVVSGEVRVAGTPVPQFHLAELRGDGDFIELESAASTRLLFGHADPIGEPVVAWGPFVMNTRDEIVQAVADYESGKFGKAG